jgi:hypothetical protein
VRVCVCVKVKRFIISFCSHYDEAQLDEGVVTWR